MGLLNSHICKSFLLFTTVFFHYESHLSFHLTVQEVATPCPVCFCVVGLDPG
uniref:Uncharacterized protein n=1 Tax=Arundo donax TaxID=35708 RepID=A0A0A9BDQ9_ARUDO